MSNVSEAAVIRDMNAYELEQEYNKHKATISKKHKYSNQNVYARQMMNIISKYYFQLTHKNINND